MNKTLGYDEAGPHKLELRELVIAYLARLEWSLVCYENLIKKNLRGRYIDWDNKRLEITPCLPGDRLMHELGHICYSLIISNSTERYDYESTEIQAVLQKKWGLPQTYLGGISATERAYEWVKILETL